MVWADEIPFSHLGLSISSITMHKLHSSHAFAYIRDEGPDNCAVQTMQCNVTVTSLSLPLFFSVYLAIFYAAAEHFRLWFNAHCISWESLNCLCWCWLFVCYVAGMHVTWRWEHWCHLFWQGVWLLWEVCAGFCLNSHFSAVFTVYSREIGCRCGRHCLICTAQLSVHNAQNLVRGLLSGSYSTPVGENALVCSRYSICFKKYRAELFQNVIWELSCMLLKWQTLCCAHKHAYYSTLTFTLVMLT